DVVDVNPAHPLLAAGWAEAAATANGGRTDDREPAEDRGHDPKRTLASSQDDPRADGGQADAQGFGGLRCLFPLAADDGHEVGARGALLSQLLVAMGTIITNRRCLDEHLRTGLRPRKGGNDVLG